MKVDEDFLARYAVEFHCCFHAAVVRVRVDTEIARSLISKSHGNITDSVQVTSSQQTFLQSWLFCKSHVQIPYLTSSV